MSLLLSSTLSLWKHCSSKVDQQERAGAWRTRGGRMEVVIEGDIGLSDAEGIEAPAGRD